MPLPNETLNQTIVEPIDPVEQADPVIDPYAPSVCLDPADCQEEIDDALAAPKKRNCGRCGPKSAAGKARAAKNSFRHGSCAATLILECESQEGFDRLLARWVTLFQPTYDTVEYDLVLKVAQAEWRRIRTQRNYDDYLNGPLNGRSPFNWNDQETKKHDLYLRYKTTAECTFHRELRTLEQHYKIHHPKPASSRPAPPSPDPQQEMPSMLVITEDAASPTGYICLREHPPRPGVTYPCPTPAPPNPLRLHKYEGLDLKKLQQRTENPEQHK